MDTENYTTRPYVSGERSIRVLMHPSVQEWFDMVMEEAHFELYALPGDPSSEPVYALRPTGEEPGHKSWNLFAERGHNPRKPSKPT